MLAAFLTQKETGSVIQDLLCIFLRVTPIAALFLVARTQIETARPRLQFRLLQLAPQQKDAQSNRVNGAAVIQIVELGRLRTTLRQVIDRFTVHEVLVLQELQRGAQFLGGQLQARGHVVVAQKLFAQQHVNQTHDIVVIERPGCGRYEGFRVDGEIGHDERGLIIDYCVAKIILRLSLVS